MCGIAGFLTASTTFKRIKADYMEQALYADALRGRHSTGLFTVQDATNQVFYNKDSVDAQRYLDHGPTLRYVRSVDQGCKVAVGHNRHATLGGRGRESAHPFITTNVILVHNGTLNSYHAMPKHPDTDVDSARIAMALDAEDPKDATKVLKELKGAYALVWYDKRDETLRIARNVERPLSYILVGDTLYFASEGPMIEWLLRRNGLVLGGHTATPFEVHTVYKFPIQCTEKELAKPKVQTYTPPKAIVQEKPAGWWRTTGQAAKGNSGKVGGKAGDDAARCNAALKAAKLDCSFGDIIEVQCPQVIPYAAGSQTGKVEGWLAAEDEELVTMDDFRGGVWVDVHQAPCKLEGGIVPESIYVRIVGVRPETSYYEHMNSSDVLLTGVFEGVACRNEPMDWKNKEMRDFFDGRRHRYHEQDGATMEVCGELLTDREFDLWTDSLECVKCGTPADYIPRQDVTLSRTGRTLACAECSSQHKRAVKRLLKNDAGSPIKIVA